MKYTVYKTVNLVNGKYYFGIHKTMNSDDDYLGSGTYIKRAVAKYGPEKFRKDVLFVYLDAESAFAKEDELIQSYRGHDPLCKNLRKGGSGGFDWINKNGLSAEGGRRGLVTRHKRIKVDPEYRAQLAAKTNWRTAKNHPKSIANDAKARIRGQVAGAKKWKGQKHTLASRAVMSALQQGKANSQFGTCWITNGIGNRKMSRDLPVPEGWKRGRV